jgi:hypothetical protein
MGHRVYNTLNLGRGCVPVRRRQAFAVRLGCFLFVRLAGYRGGGVSGGTSSQTSRRAGVNLSGRTVPIGQTCRSNQVASLCRMKRRPNRSANPTKGHAPLRGHRSRIGKPERRLLRHVQFPRRRGALIAARRIAVGAAKWLTGFVMGWTANARAVKLQLRSDNAAESIVRICNDQPTRPWPHPPAG